MENMECVCVVRNKSSPSLFCFTFLLFFFINITFKDPVNDSYFLKILGLACSLNNAPLFFFLFVNSLASITSVSFQPI